MPELGGIIDFLTDSWTETDIVLIGDFLGIVVESWSRVQRQGHKSAEPCSVDRPSCVTQTTPAP